MAGALGKPSPLRTLALFLLLSAATGRPSKKTTPRPREDDGVDAEVFCKTRSRLIRLEKADEIYIVDSFVNRSAVLECKYCEEKDNGLPKTWNIQRHIFTGNITELETDMNSNLSAASIYVNKKHYLVFRSLQEKDMALYFCRAPYEDTPDKTFNYLIDLSSEPPEEVKGNINDLKNYTEEYIGAVNEILSNLTFSVHDVPFKMKVYNDWSEWSECDACFRKDGIRFRFGKCRVKPICQDSRECVLRRKKLTSFVFNDRQNTEKPTTNESKVVEPAVVEEDLVEMGIALSCRSLLLLSLIPDLYKITWTVPDFVLNEKCSASCKGKPLKRGPRYRKSIILAKGAHLTLVCPDSTIDSQVVWEHNKRRLRSNEGTDYIPGSNEPRLYVDSFNTLYLFEVTEAESGNYTCFVDGVRMQEVKILVLTRSIFFTKEFTRHLKYLGLVFLICFVGYLAGVILMCAKTHSENKRNVRKKRSDKRKLLSEESDSDD